MKGLSSSLKHIIMLVTVLKSWDTSLFLTSALCNEQYWIKYFFQRLSWERNELMLPRKFLKWKNALNWSNICSSSLKLFSCSVCHCCLKSIYSGFAYIALWDPDFIKFQQEYNLFPGLENNHTRKCFFSGNFTT